MKIFRNLFRKKLDILTFFDILENYKKTIKFKNINGKDLVKLSMSTMSTYIALDNYKIYEDDVLKVLSELEILVNKKLAENKIGTANDVELIGIGLEEYNKNSVYLWVAVKYKRTIGKAMKGIIADFNVAKIV